MICKEFPDLQWLKKQVEDGFANRQAWGGKTLALKGWPTVILNASTRSTYRDNIRGPLSIFTNISGLSTVGCGNKSTRVQPGFFYLTNQDQHYTLEINQKTSVETFNIHFGEYWTDQVLRTLSARPEALIDEAIFSPPFQRIEFHNKLYFRDTTFNRIIAELRNNEGSMQEEEKLYSLLTHLLRQDRQVRKLESKIPALKNSTRQEIIRRLHLATDYIYSYHTQNISLEELAAVSCLSKFHFLRLFKIAFQKTPHQFINEIKVEQAKLLLKDPRMEVNTIAGSLGFQNASSFSRMFYQHTGTYPSQYR